VVGGSLIYRYLMSCLGILRVEDYQRWERRVVRVWQNSYLVDVE
jgi:hypothetical protein